jgi:uncharacterized membrane protein
MIISYSPLHLYRFYFILCLLIDKLIVLIDFIVFIYLKLFFFKEKLSIDRELGSKAREIERNKFFLLKFFFQY